MIGNLQNMLAIKEKGLQELLEKRKALIGGSPVTGAGLFLGGINMLYLFGGKDFLQTIIGGAMVFISLWKPARIILGSSSLTNGLRNLWYGHDDLFTEIKNMDQTEHAHSIIVIKDYFEKFPNRYLVYEDERWECRLFPNYHTKGTDEENMEYLRGKLSGDLQIPVDSISMRYVKNVIQEKFSESHKENRRYNHIFYMAEIRDFPKNERRNTFSINGKKYYWMTIDAMKKDEKIQQKNMDVVKEVDAI